MNARSDASKTREKPSPAAEFEARKARALEAEHERKRHERAAAARREAEEAVESAAWLAERETYKKRLEEYDARSAVLVLELVALRAERAAFQRDGTVKYDENRERQFNPRHESLGFVRAVNAERQRRGVHREAVENIGRSITHAAFVFDY
jgi:hypothetical protein